MHRKSGRFIDNDDVGVIIDEGQWDVLGNNFRRDISWDCEVYLVILLQFERGFCERSVHQNVTIFDQFLYTRAG